MTFNILHLTGEQIRAARALSRIEQTDLARRSGLSLETIKRLERIRGPVEANARTLRAIQSAFEALDIQFDGDGQGREGVVRRTAPTTDPKALSKTSEDAQARATRLRRLIFSGKISSGRGGSLRPILAVLYAHASQLHTNFGITGLTLVHGGTVLQAFECQQENLEDVIRSHNACPERADLRTVHNYPAGHRLFSDMGFCCGQFPSDRFAWLEQGSNGFQPEALTASEAMALLMEAQKRQIAPPRQEFFTPRHCTLSEQCLDITCCNRSTKDRGFFARQA